MDRAAVGHGWVFDRREVSLNVSDVPELFTPAGKRPINPYHVSIRYDIASREVRSITVVGKGEPNPRNYRERSGIVRRRVEEANAPVWLKELIEEYRP